jgi:hypothetical protein
MNSNPTGIVYIDCWINTPAAVKSHLLLKCKKLGLPLVGVMDTTFNEMEAKFSLGGANAIEAINELQIIVGKLNQEGFNDDTTAPKKIVAIIKNYKLNPFPD